MARARPALALLWLVGAFAAPLPAQDELNPALTRENTYLLVMQMCASPDEVIRVTGVAALGGTLLPPADARHEAAVLVGLSKDAEEYVRIRALQAMGTRAGVYPSYDGGNEACGQVIERVREALSEDDDGIKTAAAWAVAKMWMAAVHRARHSAPHRELASRAGAMVSGVLNDEAIQSRSFLLFALREKAGEAGLVARDSEATREVVRPVIEQLVRTTQGADLELAGEAREVLDQFVLVLGAEDEWAKQIATTAGLGPPAGDSRAPVAGARLTPESTREWALLPDGSGKVRNIAFRPWLGSLKVIGQVETSGLEDTTTKPVMYKYSILVYGANGEYLGGDEFSVVRSSRASVHAFEVLLLDVKPQDAASVEIRSLGAWTAK